LLNEVAAASSKPLTRDSARSLWSFASLRASSSEALRTKVRRRRQRATR
jgi:hypothetical protein